MAAARASSELATSAGTRFQSTMPMKISVPIPTQNSGSRSNSMSASLRLDRRDGLGGVFGAHRYADQPLHDLRSGFGGSIPDPDQRLAAFGADALFGDAKRVLCFGVRRGFQALDFRDGDFPVLVGKLMRAGARLCQCRLIGGQRALRLFAEIFRASRRALRPAAPLPDGSFDHRPRFVPQPV